MIGVIVDGAGDFSSISRRFRGRVKVAKSGGPRGHTVTTSQIANSAGKQIELLRIRGCQRVIVLVDFESRTEPHGQFLNRLATEIGSRDCGCPVDVAVPNQMIENWYLADIEELSKTRAYIRNGLAQRHDEGTHGKNRLKSCFVHGVTYNEVKHGPQLFETVRFATARENSPSLRHFLELLRAGGVS